MKPDIRQKVIVMAFVRCLRDPFAPARLAALNALRSTQMFYPLQSAATQVMPALCHLTIDQEKKVRDEAFKLLNEFIEKVRRVSENPAVIDEIESELEVSYSNNNKFRNTLAGAWASWAVSSFTSKLSLSKSAAKPDNKPDNKPDSRPENKPQTTSNNLPSANSTSNGAKRLDQSTGLSTRSEEKKSDASDYEAWDDAEDRLSLSGKESRSMNLKSIRSEIDDLKTEKCGWEIDDDLNGFKDEKTDPFGKDDEFGSIKGDSRPSNKSSACPDKRLPNNASIHTSARPQTIAKSKSKTLEDELFESLAEPTTRKKRTGAMKLGAKKA